MRSPSWLKDAVFYEIYPQSFYDTNGDGIGDLNGIKEKLDYIKSLGCNAIWINPCFDSPFKDAGYDVRDYKKIAPRYGTNEDMYELLKVAHEKGIKILLDLVPCHTSEEHEWFQNSKISAESQYSSRYVWTNDAFTKGRGATFVGGEAPRSGTYAISYFHCQPSLNYGYLEPINSWEKGIDDPDCLATREAIKDVIKFWLSHGVDGFRVDMAACLVREDRDEMGTMKVWEDIFKDIKSCYPESAFIAEWGHPDRSIKCGFDMEFTLDHGWDGGNFYHHLVRTHRYDEKMEKVINDDSYLKWNTSKSPMKFLKEYLAHYEATKDLGYISFLTDNHDMVRISKFLNEEELKMFYAFMFLMPGVPFLYYGDEIGMKYLNVPTKEGGYRRTGSRTPMQWDNSKNLGFSTADASELYLPVDDSKDAPTVAKNAAEPHSLLNFVKEIIALRRSNEELGSKANFELIYAEESSKLMVYKRGDFIFFINPSYNTYEFDAKSKNIEVLQRFWGINGEISIDKDLIIVPATSFNIYKTK